MNRTITVAGAYYGLDKTLSKVFLEEDKNYVALVFTRTDAHQMTGNNTFVFSLGFTRDCDMPRTDEVNASDIVMFHTEAQVYFGRIGYDAEFKSKVVDTSNGLAICNYAPPLEVYMIATDFIKSSLQSRQL